MKTKFLSALLALTPLFASAAGPHTYSGSPFVVPDGNPSGAWSSITVSGEDPALSDVRVTLNLSGGYNGDLYAYLNYSGHLVPLLNRVGLSGTNAFGADGAGMNVTLADSAGANIHAAGNGFLSGTYRADGQNLSPLSPPGSFNANGGLITLDGTFAGLNPNGDWTLFIADVVSGGGPATLNSWSLIITAVPEPNALQLGALGLVIGGMLLNAAKHRRGVTYSQ
jgi:hypothetical protein